MALITCPECGHTVSDKAASCPQCGFPLQVSSDNNAENAELSQNAVGTPEASAAPSVEEADAPAKKKGGAWKYLLIALLVLLVVGGIAVSNHNSSEAGEADADSTAVSTMPTNTAEAVAWVKEHHPSAQFTTSGLGYEVIHEADGTQPERDQEVMYDYRLTNLRGDVIDEGENVKSDINTLIPGLTEGLLMMTTGSTYTFYIPTELAYNNPNDENAPAGFVIATIHLKEIVVKDFIVGGKTYRGLEVKDNAGLEGNEHAETAYTITCYKDGTMTWHSKTDFHNGYENKYQGEWKKNSGSKYDNSYVWYEFWGDTYDLHMNKHHSMIGFVDEQGHLYTMFSVEDPVMAIYNNDYVCTLMAE